MAGQDRRISRRTLMAGTAAVPLTTWLLAACGDNGGGGGGGGGGGTPESLRLSDWLGDQMDHYLPTMEEYTGIKIDHEVYAFNDYKLMTQLAGGTAPDLFGISATYNGDFLPYPEFYVDMNPHLERNKVDMSKFNLDPMVEYGWDGRLGGLSFSTPQDIIVHCNTEMADKDGLLDDAPLWGKDNFDKWSWDTFVDFLKEGTHVVNGETVQYGMGNLPAYANVFKEWVYDFGGTLFDDDWSYDETKSMLDSEECLEAAMRYYDLVFTHKVAVPPELENTIQGQQQTGSYLGKLGMCTLMNSTGSIFPEAGNFPMTYFHQPFAHNRTHGVGLSQWSVYGQTKYPDAAADWLIKFITDPEIGKLFLQYSSSVPTYDPLTIVNAAPDNNAKTIALINLSRIPDFSETPDNAAATTNFPKWFGRYVGDATQDLIESMLQEIVGGSKTPQEALADAKEQLDAKIESGRQAAGV
jgi:multiple sugar transport system substrate-binding protein